MLPLANSYLSDLAQQVASTSAFLGGFAATILATLLTLQAKGRAASWSIAASAVASVSFVAAVMGSIRLVALTHPEGPTAGVAVSGLVRTASLLPFILGLFALLVAIGASGFLRSRRMGWGTATLAGVGALMVGWALTL
jgi:hypothetical protein